MKKIERSGTRFLVAIAAVLTLLLSLNSGALAQDYASQTTVTLSTAPAAGGTVIVSGTGPTGATVAAGVDGSTLANIVIGADGTFSFPATIPSNLAVGDHMFAVTVEGVTVSMTSFAVAGAQDSGEQAAQLPNTGSESLPLAQIALGLIGAGSLMLILRRRQLAAAE